MKVAVGQFGAPTAVLNASLFGVLDTLQQANAQVYGIYGGARGLLNGHFLELVNGGAQDWLQRVPGAALAAGRQAGFAEASKEAVSKLKTEHFDALIVLGGNGTMALAQSIEQQAERARWKLPVIGVPKTIDNDIMGVDHTPGYPSAAQFVLQALRDLAIDLEAMVGFEQVRVVEVMGRRSGWLAAVADCYGEVCGLNDTRIHPIVCLPEQVFHLDVFLAEVEARVQADGCTMVVVSEGVEIQQGERILQMGTESSQSGTFMLGGVGAWLANAIRVHTGYGTRYENLGLLQRCWADSSVPLDVAEAVELGQAGAVRALRGEGGSMVGLVRRPGATYQTEVVDLPFEQVASKERVLTGQELRLGASFCNWLRPLLDWTRLQPHQRFPKPETVTMQHK